MDKSGLSTRMKESYENSTRSYLPRRSYTIIRIDGKAFHTFTKDLEIPFDYGFVEDMNTTAKYLCKNIMGAKLAYVQSDEISIVITDFDQITTEAWFKNNVQKMVSVSASMATKAFNQARLNRLGIEYMKWGEFDSRVFQIPQYTEVLNYLIWRQNDAVRNSISSLAQSLYTHPELMNKNTAMMQDMIIAKGLNWNDLNPALKRGRIIRKISEKGPFDEVQTYWIDEAADIFTQNKEVLFETIPENK